MQDSEELSRRTFVKRVFGSVAAVGLGLTAAAVAPKAPKGWGPGRYTVYMYDRDCTPLGIRYVTLSSGVDRIPSTIDRRQEV